MQELPARGKRRRTAAKWPFCTTQSRVYTRAVNAPEPANEALRLATLHGFEVLDTPAEPGFDRITRLAEHLFGCPIVLVSLVDAQRQWFKSEVGLDVHQTPREIAFCAHAILNSEILEVPDASLDPRFFDNPLVRGEPRVRFYAGAPLEVDPGVRLGTLCLIDRVPRTLSSEERQLLGSLAATVVELLQGRRSSATLVSACRLLEEENADIQAMGAALRRDVSSQLMRIEAMLGLFKDGHAHEIGELGREELTLMQSLAGRANLASRGLHDLMRLRPAVPAERREVDARGLITGCGDSLRSIYPQGSTCVELDDLVVLTHEGYIRQIFSYLLDHAFRRGAHLVVVRGGHDHGRWTVTIADDGPGIPPEEAASAFEPVSSLGQDGAWGGMGLAASRRLARMLGGRLVFEPEHIGGAVFRLELPQPPI